MSVNRDNITSLAAARKERQRKARVSAASNRSPAEVLVKRQVWVLLFAVAAAYLAYAYFSGAGRS